MSGVRGSTLGGWVDPAGRSRFDSGLTVIGWRDEGSIPSRRSWSVVRDWVLTRHYERMEPVPFALFFDDSPANAGWATYMVAFFIASIYKNEPHIQYVARFLLYITRLASAPTTADSVRPVVGSLATP